VALAVDALRSREGGTAVSAPGAARLSLWDGVSVVIGIVVGVSLFKAPALVFGNVGSPLAGLGVWALGGVLSLLGALCYAELAAAWPRSGGDYVYLTRAYGPASGFLFGWGQLVAILTGSIGAMAYVFADYVAALGVGVTGAVVASASVVAVTALNLVGVQAGRRVQNALTLTKVVGLAGIVAVGVFGPSLAAPAARPGSGDAAFALILVLYAYGGWQHAAYVAAEVEDAQRNVPRVLVLGTGAVALIYLAVNAAYLAGFGFDGLRASSAPAAELLARSLGSVAGRIMSVLVMVSALGAIQGMVFTGARIYASMGDDHAAFASLGRWHPRLGVPARALVAQAAVSLAWIAAVGTHAGRASLDALTAALRLPALPWERFDGGFDLLVASTAPVFWLFFLATGSAVLVLRVREPDAPRPFRVPGYPLTPLAFCASCAFMIEASLRYAGGLALAGILPLALGLPVYAWSRRASPARTASPK
jgi:amino acid transporter